MRPDPDLSPSIAPLRVGNVALDIDRREVVIGAGYAWQPSRLLFRVLLILARNAGRVVSVDRIMYSLYAGEEDGGADDGIVAVLVSRLRTNLALGGADVEIRNLRREGYILDAIGRRPERDTRQRRRELPA